MAGVEENYRSGWSRRSRENWSVCVFVCYSCTVKRKCLINLHSAGVSEILPNKISSFNGCKNLCFRKTKQTIYYLLAPHLLRSDVEEAVSKMLCCKSATEQHELQSDLVNVMQPVLCSYVGFVFFCVHSRSGFPRSVFVLFMSL